MGGVNSTILIVILYYIYFRSFSQFLGLIFSPETTLEKALNINDILNSSSALSEQNPRPKNRENDREWV